MDANCACTTARELQAEKPQPFLVFSSSTFISEGGIIVIMWTANNLLSALQEETLYLLRLFAIQTSLKR